MLNIISKKLREKEKKKGLMINSFCQNLEYDVIIASKFSYFAVVYGFMHICVHPPTHTRDVCLYEQQTK